MKERCLILGAGAIGKSVCGALFSGLGMEIRFVDAIPAVVEDINRRGGYRIYTSPQRFEEVRGAAAFLSTDVNGLISEIRGADWIATALGPAGMKAVWPSLTEGLRSRDAAARVVFCENQKGLREALISELQSAGAPSLGTQILAASVERMTRPYPRGDAFDVIAEPYLPLILDRGALEAGSEMLSHPELVQPVDDLAAYYARKLYTNNMGHAVLGYLGLPKGYQTVAEAAADKEILALLRAALSECGEMLVRRYGFSREEMDRHIASLLEVRYPNKNLSDALCRVARDPIRKLGRGERLIGAALACMDCGVAPAALTEAILAALRCQVPGDEASAALQAKRRACSKEQILADICGLSPEEPLFAALLRRMD